MTTVLQTFRDTVSPARMPITATYSGVLAYANGRYAWPQAQIDRFVKAGKHLYRIDVLGNLPHGASILDVERGDATPQTASKWVPQRNAFEGDAAVYTAKSNVPAVLEACKGERFWLIVADWTGQPHVPALQLPQHVRLAAVQYANGQLWDTTAVYSADWLAGRHIQ